MAVPKVRITNNSGPTPQVISFQDLSSLTLSGNGEINHLPVTMLGERQVLRVLPVVDLSKQEQLPEIDDPNFITVARKVIEDHIKSTRAIVIQDGMGSVVTTTYPTVLDTLRDPVKEHEVFINHLYTVFNPKVPEYELLATQELFNVQAITDDERFRIVIIVLFGLLMVQYRRLVNPSIAQQLLLEFPGHKPFVLHELLAYLATLQDSFVVGGSIDVMVNITTDKGPGNIDVYKKLVNNYSASYELHLDNTILVFEQWVGELMRIVPTAIKSTVERFIIETSNKHIDTIYRDYGRYQSDNPIVKLILRKGHAYRKSKYLLLQGVSASGLTSRYPHARVRLEG